MSYSGEGFLANGQIEGDPNKTVVPIAVNSDGELIVNLEASSITIGEVDQGAPNTPANAWPVKLVDAAGVNEAAVNGAGAVSIVAGALPLPAGAATELTLSNLNSKVTAVNTGAVVVSSGTITATQGTGTNLHTVVDNFPATQPISGSVSVSNFPATQPISGSVSVSNFPATQPVSGTVTADAGTNLNTSLLALDTTVAGLSVAAASTTSGQKGFLLMGATHTTSPNSSDATTNPLSLTTNGSLLRTAICSSQTTSLDHVLTQYALNNDNGTITAVGAEQWQYGGAFSGTTDAARRGWVKARTPTVFRTVQATASGNTAVWTAGTNNKWLLIAYRIELTSNVSLSSGAVLTVKFQDVSSDINVTHDVFVPTTAVTTVAGDAYDTGWTSLGTFGILAAATATALNINLSAALATGNVRVITAGTEE